ncbi:hypothetical protein OSH10_05060 [Kaistia defluvii]|uniref:hypothetical protein n=1 Tax=Kaistia defluvii TaxID=410841 RepID=UPI0022546BD4|nr:hypothetical protein [Kaistia defluvii]MCX5517796.1 hypothetical protein [Kaistia defluvii]
MRNIRASPPDQAQSDRLTAIIAAAQTKDWEQFRALSDQAFVNEAAMREQFDASCASADFTLVRIPDTVRAVRDGRKGTMLSIEIPNGTRGKPGIMLMVYEPSRKDGIREFGIWVFSEIPNFD